MGKLYFFIGFLFVCLFAFALGFCLGTKQKKHFFPLPKEHFLIMKTSVSSLILLPYPRESKRFRPPWGHTKISKQSAQFL